MKPSVFVIMPFNDDYFALYEEFKNVLGNDYEFQNAGDLDSQQNILKDIVVGINNADVIIADLTNLNANVFYELGLAHAMNKSVIIITQDIGELPFDIKSYRAIEYGLQFNKLPKLLNKLKELLAGAMDGTIKYGNPVSDFIPINIAQTVYNVDSLTETLATEIIENEGDKGYLDYIIEIRENADKMTFELNSMSDEMLELNNSINNTNEEIERVKRLNKNVDTSFIRNLCRKLSEPVDLFSKKIKNHTQIISKCWGNIENDYLLIIDNNYAQFEVNKNDLKKSLSELIEMQNAIEDSNKKIELLINGLRTGLGIEKKLNQALSNLISEFEVYLSETDAMYSSIDRILLKSEMILGE